MTRFDDHTITIYVYLPDEAVDVWCPVQALVKGDNLYELLPKDSYDEELERWEFPPGTLVSGETKNLSDGPTLVAVKASSSK